MNEPTLQVLEEVADAYEKRLVPALFATWAYRLADAAEIQQGQHLLDVACGTGILTRVIAERVGAEGSVSGVDINPGMIAVANRIAPEIEWREGDVEALPYEDDSFDVVFCQFGLMLFSSPKNALQEMQRVLKPGGRLLVSVFGALEDLPAYAAIADVYEQVVNQSVADALRMPFSMGDTDALTSVFTSAGIHSAEMNLEERMACFASVKDMVLSDAKGWFPFAGIHLDEDTIELVTKNAETALKAFHTSGGAVEFPVRVQIVTATKS